MTSSLPSPMDANDHNTRNQHHPRFPSLSQFSDSPSVYSHPYFTPRPHDSADDDDDAPISHSRSPYSHRDRLNDPTASSLDLDDEPSPAASSNTCGQGDHHNPNDSDPDSEHRMSLLGPKMRFHSRAPWETGEDTREEGNESDRSSKSRLFGKKNSTKTSRGEVIIRAFGRATSTARPSGESARSQPKQKNSFEITAGNYSSSRGALYTLAHESLSTSSLTPSPSSSVGPSMARQNFSLPRTGQFQLSHNPSVRALADSHQILAASHSFTNYIQTSPSSQGTNSSPSSDIPRPYARTRTPSSPHSSHKRPSNDDFVHPYANPDLVVSYVPERFPCSPSRSVFSHMPRSESNATVTDTMSSRSGAVSTITPDTSAASLAPKARELVLPSSNRIQGKEISAPVSVNNPTLRTHDLNSLRINHDRETKLLVPGGPNGFQRWIDHPTSPTVTLISLQEAQALARERSRSATVNDPASSNTTLTRLAFPESQENSISHESNSSGASQSPPGGRVRGRSISAGARARNALHSMVGAPQVEPTSGQGGPRALKHKKSGFMRIFNGREREKDKTMPPPVPALSDVYSETNVSYQHIPKTPKLPPSRVPVPSLSPSLLQDSNGGTSLQGVLVTQDVLEVSQAEHFVKQNLSPQRKHTPPPLSIVTGGTGARSLSSAQPPPQPRITPIASAIFVSAPQSPQSAPPGTTDFQALKLRPVSTTFSAHFTDIVVGPQAESPTDMDSGSASSLGTAMSPMTPGSALRSDGRPSVSVTPGDQSVVIQALQDQIISAKKAWQRQIWELEGQVRDLKAEVEDLRGTEGRERDYCEVCRRGSMHGDHDDRGAREFSKELEARKGGGVVNRPRARTGDAARFGSGY